MTVMKMINIESGNERWRTLSRDDIVEVNVHFGEENTNTTHEGKGGNANMLA